MYDLKCYMNGTRTDTFTGTGIKNREIAILSVRLAAIKALSFHVIKSKMVWNGRI